MVSLDAFCMLFILLDLSLCTVVTLFHANAVALIGFCLSYRLDEIECATSKCGKLKYEF